MERLYADYQARLAAFRLTSSRTGCAAACALMEAGVGLDLAFYPQQAMTLSIARSIVTLPLVVILVLLYRPQGVAHVRELTLLWLALPQAVAIWMVYATDGSHSPYVLGLALPLFASILMPIGLLQLAGLGLLTCLGYVAACLLYGGDWRPDRVLIGNALLLALSAILAIICSYFNKRGRQEVARLQQEVAEKHTTVRRTNAALSEIKGQMVQQEKMAAIGTLSAGLLHEINNPVNYSMLALNMALTDPATDTSPDLKESLVDAREGMQRVQNIVSDLKTFAYQQPGGNAKRIFSFEKSLQAALRLTGHETKGFTVNIALPQDAQVIGDEPAIISVLVNLLGNAAMALRADTGREPTQPGGIDVDVTREGPRLRVRVRDNGVGIAPEHLSHVFEPFYTTREVGQGLGLGLSVCYAIVQRHGGQLSVESTLGGWTEFMFDLQLANSDTPAHGQADLAQQTQDTMPKETT